MGSALSAYERGYPTFPSAAIITINKKLMNRLQMFNQNNPSLPIVFDSHAEFVILQPLVFAVTQKVRV